MQDEPYRVFHRERLIKCGGGAFACQKIGRKVSQSHLVLCSTPCLSSASSHSKSPKARIESPDFARPCSSSSVIVWDPVEVASHCIAGCTSSLLNTGVALCCNLNAKWPQRSGALCKMFLESEKFSDESSSMSHDFHVYSYPSHADGVVALAESGCSKILWL